MKKNYHPKHLPHPNVPQHSKTPPTKTPFFFRNICHFSLAALLSTFLLQSDSLTDKNISKITNPIINNIDNDYISRNDSIRNIYHVIYPSLSNSNTLELTQEISNYLKNNTDSTDRVSLYIEELSTNYKLTSKQNELFMSASLGKVYVLMAALYRSQTHEGFLDEMIYYKNPSSVILPQTISDEFVLQEGNTYPVSVLLKNMISHSDNISYYLVDDHLLKSIDPSNKTV